MTKVSLAGNNEKLGLLIHSLFQGSGDNGQQHVFGWSLEDISKTSGWRPASYKVQGDHFCNQYSSSSHAGPVSTQVKSSYKIISASRPDYIKGSVNSSAVLE